MSRSTRFFVNTLPDWRPERKYQSFDFTGPFTSTLDYILSEPNTHEPYVYTGIAGISYTLVHTRQDHLIEEALQLSRTSISIAVRHHRHSYSLALGTAGCLYTHAITAHRASLLLGTSHLSDELQQECQNSIESYFDLHALALECQEDEFLYGRAGYLFGALALQHIHSLTKYKPIISALVTKIIAVGRQQRVKNGAQCPLVYLWPPGKGGDPYLGAAHGLMGIVYVLLHLPEVIEQIDPGAWYDVQASLSYILQLECDSDGERRPAGYYPTRMLADSPKQPLVHWCHGSTGAVFLFAKAAEVFPRGRDVFLSAVERAGEVIGERGLLKKGPGLCHGVSGSAYALLCVYQATGDEKWIHRATEFGKYMIFSDDFRRDAGTPDHPKSLFEGWGGAACLFSDLMEPQKAEGFPLFQMLRRL